MQDGLGNDVFQMLALTFDVAQRGGHHSGGRALALLDRIDGFGGTVLTHQRRGGGNGRLHGGTGLREEDRAQYHQHHGNGTQRQDHIADGTALGDFATDRFLLRFGDGRGCTFKHEHRQHSGLLARGQRLGDVGRGLAPELELAAAGRHQRTGTLIADAVDSDIAQAQQRALHLGAVGQEEAARLLAHGRQLAQLLVGGGKHLRGLVAIGQRRKGLRLHQFNAEAFQRGAGLGKGSRQQIAGFLVVDGGFFGQIRFVGEPAGLVVQRQYAGLERGDFRVQCSLLLRRVALHLLQLRRQLALLRRQEGEFLAIGFVDRDWFGRGRRGCCDRRRRRGGGGLGRLRILRRQPAGDQQAQRHQAMLRALHCTPPASALGSSNQPWRICLPRASK